jgi:hypothetical protein
MKTSHVLSGCALAATLLVTGCGATPEPASNEQPGAPSSAASLQPTAKSIDPGVLKNLESMKLGTGYDVAATTFLKPATAIAAVLDKGVITKPLDADTAYTFIDYDGTEGWIVTAPKVQQVNRIVWDGKEYVAFFTTDIVKGDTSGISKSQDAQFSVVSVYDTENGKLVKEHRAAGPDKSGSNEWVLPMVWNQDPSYTGQNGLEYSRWKPSGGQNRAAGHKTVNPVTGETIKEIDIPLDGPDSVTMSGVTSAGDFILRKGSRSSPASSLSIPGLPGIPDVRNARVSGKFIFTEINSPGGTSPRIQVLDGSTGKSVAEPIVCGGDLAEPKSSANGRFHMIGNFAVDTQTGKTFCGDETKDQKGLKLAAVDNNGNVYGKSTSSDKSGNFGYQVGIVDETSAPIGKLPVAINKDQIGVFEIEPNGFIQSAFAVPLKK